MQPQSEGVYVAVRVAVVLGMVALLVFAARALHVAGWGSRAASPSAAGGRAPAAPAGSPAQLSLASDGPVELAVDGRPVGRLPASFPLPAGEHRLAWRGPDGEGGSRLVTLHPGQALRCQVEVEEEALRCR